MRCKFIGKCFICVLICIVLFFCSRSIVSAEETEPILSEVEMTYYLPTGNVCANGKEPRAGIVAFAPQYIGYGMIIYESIDGKVGDVIGIYEICDTGYGKTLPSGCGSIEDGKTVDVFFENDEAGKQFIAEHGNKVFIQLVDAKG